LIQQKLFCEIRYPGQIDIIGNPSSLVKLYYPEKFKHWTIEGHTIKLHDSHPFERSNETLVIEPKRFIYACEQPTPISVFIDRLISYFNKLSKEINVNFIGN